MGEFSIVPLGPTLVEGVALVVCTFEMLPITGHSALFVNGFGGGLPGIAEAPVVHDSLG